MFHDDYFTDGNMGGWLSSAVSSVKKGVSKVARETKRAAKDSWSRAKTAGKAYVLSGGNPAAAGAAVVGEELMKREEKKAEAEQKKLEKEYKKEEKKMLKEQDSYYARVAAANKAAAMANAKPIIPPKPKRLTQAQIRTRLMFFQNLAKFMLLLRSNPDRLNAYYNNMATAINKQTDPKKKAQMQKTVMGVRKWIAANPPPKIPLSTTQVEESLGLAATIMMRFKMDPAFAKQSLEEMRFENRNNPEALLKINDFILKLNDFKPTAQDMADWNQLQREGGAVEVGPNGGLVPKKGGALPLIAAVGVGAAMLMGG